ncbi:MAG TPA: hypothetical protein VHK24_07540 [Steroidobacter sp.]|jgi:hypothetical protein|nr:hypothetical protein [Steroidobacter sp.]
MHRTLAAWLTERPWRAAVASAVCGALSPQMLAPFAVLAAAIPSLIALRFNVKAGFGIAAAGAVAAAAVVLSVTEPSVWIVLAFGVLFVCPVLLAGLLRSSDSLNLCFQVAVLGAACVLIGVHLALADPVAVWTSLLRQVLDSMAQAGIRLEGDQDEIVAVWARTMWGALAALALATVFGGVLLGRWWLSLLQSPGQFGVEYRQLRLGVVLGTVATALFVLALASDSSLFASLAWVAFAALAFQGLAAAHRLKANGRLNRGWLAAIYVLLVVPLSMSITVFILAVWGFADNWLRPKARIA